MGKSDRFEPLPMPPGQRPRMWCPRCTQIITDWNGCTCDKKKKAGS